MKSEFDDYAGNYDAALNQGLSLSGESKEYFAHERVRWLAARLADLGVQPSRVLDYGCGTGGTSPELLEQLHARLVVGVDASRDSLDVARKAHADPRLQFSTMSDLAAVGTVRGRVLQRCLPSRRARAAPGRARLRASIAGRGRLLRLLGEQPVESRDPPRHAAHSVRSRREAPLAAARARAAHPRGIRTCCGRTSSSSFRACCRRCGRSRPGSPAFPVGAQYMVLCRKAHMLSPPAASLLIGAARRSSSSAGSSSSRARAGTGPPIRRAPPRFSRARGRRVVAGIATFVIVRIVWGSFHEPGVVHDERAYLLQAEIFARGHWTAPSPPLAAFFEQMHVFIEPAVFAKYPPAPRADARSWNLAGPAGTDAGADDRHLRCARVLARETPGQRVDRAAHLVAVDDGLGRPCSGRRRTCPRPRARRCG